MVKELIIGVVSIVIGIYLVIHTYRNPNSQLTNINFKGFAGGIGLIIVGIMFILGKIHF